MFSKSEKNCLLRKWASCLGIRKPASGVRVLRVRRGGGWAWQKRDKKTIKQKGLRKWLEVISVSLLFIFILPAQLHTWPWDFSNNPMKIVFISVRPVIFLTLIVIINAKLEGMKTVQTNDGVVLSTVRASIIMCSNYRTRPWTIGFDIVRGWLRLWRHCGSYDWRQGHCRLSSAWKCRNKCRHSQINNTPCRILILATRKGDVQPRKKPRKR